MIYAREQFMSFFTRRIEERMEARRGARTACGILYEAVRMCCMLLAAAGRQRCQITFGVDVQENQNYF